MLVKRSSLTPFYLDELDRFFGRDFMGNLWNVEENSTMPSANIEENDKAFVIELAVPGYKKENFNLSLTPQNVLTIKAEIKSGNKDEKKCFSRREYNYSSFERSFTLPDNVECNKIEAKYEDGLLKLTLPKKAEKELNSNVNILIS